MKPIARACTPACSASKEDLHLRNPNGSASMEVLHLHPKLHNKLLAVPPRGLAPQPSTNNKGSASSEDLHPKPSTKTVCQVCPQRGRTRSQTWRSEAPPYPGHENMQPIVASPKRLVQRLAKPSTHGGNSCFTTITAPRYPVIAQSRAYVKRHWPVPRPTAATTSVRTRVLAVTFR